MKKSCVDCRAYEGFVCQLGYAQKNVAPPKTGLTRMAPAEDCPKPRTVKKFIDLLKITKL